MSYTDVGKDAKRKGKMHPKHLRQIGPEPPRATPSAKPHRKAQKPFGMRYDSKMAFKFVRVPGQRHYALHWDWGIWMTTTGGLSRKAPRLMNLENWRGRHLHTPERLNRARSRLA